MNSPAIAPDTIVLIHGFWVTPRSWEHWKSYYEGKGYTVLTPAYPGFEVEVEALNADPSPIEAVTVAQIMERLEGVVGGLDAPPILIGHSAGGVFTQILLDRGYGAAGVAINSAPTEGVKRIPLSQIRATFPVLKNPANFQANDALGQFCLSERHYADAVSSLQRAHQLKPDDFQAAYDLAQAYQGAGQYEKAKALVQQQIAKGDRADWHRLLGDVEEALNNPLAAEREYERGVELEPSEQNYFAWGGELLQHRAVEAAIDVFARGVSAFPHSERMIAALGAALYAHGSYEQGAQRVCGASDLKPTDPEPYLFLGKMELASPRPLPCVTEKLARFARTQPNNSWANYYYAVALLNSDEKARRQEAETLFQRATQIDPKFAQAYLQLGILQAERDDRQSAKESFEKAAASDPNLPDPHFRLAQLYRRTGDQQRASQELQTFERLKQSDAAAVEQRRREIRQFVVVMKGAPAAVSQ